MNRLLLLVIWCVTTGALWAQETKPSGDKPTLAQLRLGHWIEAKGDLRDTVFVVSEVEVVEPADEEELIGTAVRVSGLDQRFELLGLRVDVTSETEWRDVSLDKLEGVRVKVQGRWKGGKLVAKEVSKRGEGRDRIAGRIDAIKGEAPQRVLEVMDFQLQLSGDTELDKPESLLEAKLAPERMVQRRTEVRRVDAEDYIPGSLQLSETLSFGALVDTKWTRESNRDLDETIGDQVDSPRAALRLQLLWLPTESTSVLVSPRVEYSAYLDENGEDDRGFNFKLNEVWMRQDDPWGYGAYLQVGRLDFDDDREWIWKRYLDAARVRWEKGYWNAEVSAMTLLDGDDSSDSDVRDEGTQSMYAQAGWDDGDRSVSLWVLDQRFSGVDPDPFAGDDPLDGRDWPIFFGARVLGEWIDDVDVWADLCIVRGYRDTIDIEGFGFDIGATWESAAFAPFYFTAGYAWGSGDDPATPDVNEAFRQTTWQRNNGKFGGVTSFRYYGEAMEPELSNLGILTLGVGTRIGRKNSLDLVWHTYQQDQAADFIRDSALDVDPDGISTDLGSEIDLIFGSKAIDGWDFELVYGRFAPGDAFADADATWMASAQVRYRF